MPNLYGSDLERDLRDYERIFGDPAYRPDELKLYPTSLVETAELMEKFLDGHLAALRDRRSSRGCSKSACCARRPTAG